VLLALPGGALAPLAAGGGCVGELPGAAVCSAHEPCGAGLACVLGRCRPSGTVPASFEAERVEVAPEALAAVGGGSARRATPLGDVLVVGPPGGLEVLLLRFALPERLDRTLERALLLLDPAPRCDARPGRIHLELAEIAEAWSASAVTERRRPRLGLSMRVGDLEAVPERPWRVDVTEIVRLWERRPPHGIAVLVDAAAGAGACFEAERVRLQLFYAPPDRDAGTDAADAADAASARIDAPPSRPVPVPIPFPVEEREPP
jgi:hypothetical protein